MENVVQRIEEPRLQPGNYAYATRVEMHVHLCAMHTTDSGNEPKALFTAGDVHGWIYKILGTQKRKT